MWFLAIFVGIVAVLAGILLLRSEFNAAVRSMPRSGGAEDFRRELDEINSSFFDIANDLEGKYSIHEKQLNDIELLLREYMNKQIDQRRSGKKNTKPESQNNMVPDKSEDLIPFENIGPDRVVAREAAALISEGCTFQETAKRLGVSVSALRLILGVNENK